LAVPIGGDGTLAVATHRAIAGLASTSHDVIAAVQGSSALTLNFNALWCEALNRRLAGTPIDVFCMIHTDIVPVEPDWLDRLLTILDETGADVLSAIVPIKDIKGLTSTAFDTNRWTPRRLTMTEAFTLPPTITDTPELRQRFGGPLLLNTGLMLVRFIEPWCLEACFTIDNAIHRSPDGQYCPFFEPEDWKFSRWCQARGLKLAATRAVRVGHLGQTLYDNGQAWGSLGVDSINLTNAAAADIGSVPKS
jgi:hypothetical protein